MATQILMPALSPTMEEGKLAKWLVKEGDEVHSGDILAEIETDKATMEFEAVDEGRIGKILVPEGTEGVKVNAPIAVLAGRRREGRKRRRHPVRDGVDQGGRVGRGEACFGRTLSLTLSPKGGEGNAQIFPSPPKGERVRERGCRNNLRRRQIIRHG